MKRIEYDENSKKLDLISDINDQLTADDDTSGHFSIDDDVQLLDRGFQGVKTELDRLDGIFSKGMTSYAIQSDQVIFISTTVLVLIRTHVVKEHSQSNSFDMTSS